MTYFELHCATCLFTSILVVSCRVRTVYVSPFTFGNHVRLTTGDSCLIAVNHCWSADTPIVKSEVSLNPRVLRRATPREEHVPPFDTPCLMPGFRQIIHRDDRRFASLLPLFTHEENRVIPSFPREDEIYEVWKCQDAKAWKTRLRELLYCVPFAHAGCSAHFSQARSFLRRAGRMKNLKRLRSYLGVSEGPPRATAWEWSRERSLDVLHCLREVNHTFPRHLTSLHLRVAGWGGGWAEDAVKSDYLNASSILHNIAMEFHKMTQREVVAIATEDSGRSACRKECEER